MQYGKIVVQHKNTHNDVEIFVYYMNYFNQ